MKRIILLLFIIILPSLVKSQSIGLTLGSNFYNIATISEYSSIQYGSIKDISLNYRIPLNKAFDLSLRAGYGWGSNSTKNESTELSKMKTSTSSYDYTTTGFPIEAEISYQHFLSHDSVFAPTIGMGIGYCSYTTNYSNNGSSVRDLYKTNGLSQFISFGMNVVLSSKINCYVGVKKVLFTSITTKHEITDSFYSSFYERDYATQAGLSDLGFSFGIFYNI